MGRTTHPENQARHRHLIIKDVATLFADDLLPVMRVYLDGNGVAHGSGRNKDGRLTAKNLRRAFFQSIDGWIFAINVVAHFGFGHGTAHLRRGFGNRVTTEVERGFGFLV